MKILLPLLLFIPFHKGAHYSKPSSISIDTYEIRLAPWTITMKRIIGETDTCYYLLFRDQQVLNSIQMKTMEFESLEQLKYFEKGLSTLKNGGNGDIAEYERFSIKKAIPLNSKKSDAWYILSYGNAVTNFQQAQANRIMFIINKL
jgi:hypothetical protein